MKQPGSNYNRSATIYKTINPSLRNRRSLTLHSIDIPSRGDVKSLEDVQEEILRNHQSINGIINRFKEVVAQRLQSQQLQLLMVFKSSLDKMMQEIQEIVGTYKQATSQIRQQKNFTKLQNQLQYFKTQALQLFEINQSHKKQIAQLKKIVFDLKIDQESQVKTIQKLTRKVFKLKGRNQSLLTQNSKSIQKSLPFVTQESVSKFHHQKLQERRTVTSSLYRERIKRSI